MPLVRIDVLAGRTADQLRALGDGFHSAMVETIGVLSPGTGHPGVRFEDDLVNLVEVAKENWSFGNGVAQYAP